jgi:hypothetical protein
MHTTGDPTNNRRQVNERYSLNNTHTHTFRSIVCRSLCAAGAAVLHLLDLIHGVVGGVQPAHEQHQLLLAGQLRLHCTVGGWYVAPLALLQVRRHADARRLAPLALTEGLVRVRAVVTARSVTAAAACPLHSTSRSRRCCSLFGGQERGCALTIGCVQLAVEDQQLLVQDGVVVQLGVAQLGEQTTGGGHPLLGDGTRRRRAYQKRCANDKHLRIRGETDDAAHISSTVGLAHPHHCPNQRMGAAAH